MCKVGRKGQDKVSLQERHLQVVGVLPPAGLRRDPSLEQPQAFAELPI